MDDYYIGSWGVCGTTSQYRRTQVARTGGVAGGGAGGEEKGDNQKDGIDEGGEEEKEEQQEENKNDRTRQRGGQVRTQEKKEKTIRKIKIRNIEWVREEEQK